MMKLNVYNDTQNVYNYAIQLCVRDSINLITTRSDLKKYNIDQLHVLILWLQTNNLITKILTQLLFAKGIFGEYINDTLNLWNCNNIIDVSALGNVYTLILPIHI